MLQDTGRGFGWAAHDVETLQRHGLIAPADTVRTYRLYATQLKTSGGNGDSDAEG